MSVLSTLIVKLGVDAGGFREELEHSAAQAAKFGDSIQNVGKVALGVAGGAMVALGGAVAVLGPQMISAASDLNESVSKANVVFGSAISTVDAFAASSATSFGIAKQAAYEATGTFGNLFTTIGLGKSQAADMSVDIVKLASDLASFNNLKTAEVLDKLRSGLVGETEPLRSLGVNINEAAVQAKALSMGLTKGKAPLTDAMKLQARYALILEQTKTAQGDFARTSDGLANTQRILSATFKDISADIGTAFLPVVLGVAQAVQPLVKSLMPGLQSALKKIEPIATSVGNSIGVFVDVLTRTGDPIAAIRGALDNFPDLRSTFDGMVAGVQSFIATIQPTIDQVTGWISQNISLKDVLTALGIAIASVVIPAIISIVAAAAPIVAAFLILVGVAALLRTAWENNWGGIQEKTAAVWAWLQPIIVDLVAWLRKNIPAALQALSNFWTNTLLPAIQAAWNFIQTSVFPMLQNLWNWLSVNVPAAIQTLTNFWNNTLMPAIQAIWSFVQTYLLPVFIALVDLGLHLVELAVAALAALWTTVLLPAMQTIHKFIDEKLMPIFNTVAGIVRDVLGKAFLWVAENVFPVFEKAIDGIIRGVQFLIGIIDDAIAALNKLTGNVNASPVMGHSPSLLETSLLGINAAMSDLSRMAMPRLAEAFIPATAGYILPNGASRTGPAFSAAGMRGDVNLYGDVVVYGHERTVLEELQALVV